MLITFFKANLIGAYALALACLFVVLPMEAGPVVQRLALAILAVHALECLVAFKYIKSYAGSVYLSFVLAMLYGLLHLMPLAKAYRLNQAEKAGL
jgi:uncharacterized protein YhhL (DUF1145 family)